MVAPRSREPDLHEAAVAYLRALSEDAVADVLARGRLEIFARGAPWQAEDRTVRPLRVALWLTATDRAGLTARPEWAERLRQAVAAVVESPDTLLGELLFLIERPAALATLAPAGGYRMAPMADEVAPESAAMGRPSAEIVLAIVVATLEAAGATPLADALRRARLALDPVPGVPASRVTVALDPADLALVRRDPRAQALVADAVESAVRTPSHRAADVGFVVREPRQVASPGGERGTAEIEVTAAARRVGWAVLPIERDASRTTLLLARDGACKLVRIETAHGGPPRIEKTSVGLVTVSEEEVADEAGALRIVASLG